MSTNPLERIPKRSPKTSVTDLNEFAKTAGSAAVSAAYPIMLGLTGEDTGDEWYEDLAYGAVPGGALVQRAKTGTIPGLLDLLPGDVGTAAKLAMLPVAKFGAKSIMEGAARTGKSARNLAENQMRKAGGGTTVRFHRTHAGNVDRIKNEGLRLREDNPNYGRNTRDFRGVPNVVWLGVNPYEIPVQRVPLATNPSSVAEFKVSIPNDVYRNTPRYMYPEGRGGAANARIVEKGKPSLTDEGEYKIDMFGGNIPPEYLEQIPIEDIMKGIEANNKTTEALASLLVSIDEQASRKLLNENPQLAKRIGRVADLENGGWIFGSDKSLGDEIDNLTAPISMRYENSKKSYDEVLENVNDKIGRAMKSPYGQELFFYTPNQRMRDALQQFPTDNKGRVVVGSYIPPNTKLSDLVSKDDDYGVTFKTPEELGGFSKTAPGPDQVAKGSVSHGGAQDWPSIRQRYFDYDKYNEAVTMGMQPAEAADQAAPYFKFQIDPDDVTGTRWGWYRSTGHGGSNYGMITEGKGNTFAMNKVKNLMDYARHVGLTPDTRKELHDAFKELLERGTIGRYVPSASNLSEFTPGSRLPDWDLRR